MTLKTLKNYDVSIEPKYPSGGLANSTSQYTAATRGDAIKQARRDVRNAGHDRHDGPLTYRAKLAEPAVDPLNDFNYVGSRHHY